MFSNKKKVVFIDRDGVINFDSPEYIKSEEEFDFIPDSAEAFWNSCREWIRCHNHNEPVCDRQESGFLPRPGKNFFEKMRRGVSNFGGRILDIFSVPMFPMTDAAAERSRNPA